MPFLRPIRPSDNRNTTSKIRRLEIEHSLQFDLKWGLLTKGQATNIPAEPRYSSTDLLLENAMARQADRGLPVDRFRSEEHTSELQSPCNLVCRLLLEKKKDTTTVLAIKR